MPEPIGQGHFFILRRPEHSEKLQLRVANVLHIMSIVAFDVADVAGIEIHCEHIGPGIEHAHARFTLDIILPFVRVRMPSICRNAPGCIVMSDAAMVVETLKLVLSAICTLPLFVWLTGSEDPRENVKG